MSTGCFNEREWAGDCSDAELVLRVRDGERRAFDEIDRRYREPLRRFLLRYTFGPEHAEELGQQTLVRAFEMIDQLQSAEKLAGWLHRIAFRLAAAERRRRSAVSLDAMEYVGPAPVVSDRLDEEEKKRNLWRVAEEQLSSEEFQVLLLRYRDDLSLASIAKLLGKKEGAVRVQLHRARKKLLPFFRKTIAEAEP